MVVLVPLEYVYIYNSNIRVSNDPRSCVCRRTPLNIGGKDDFSYMTVKDLIDSNKIDEFPKGLLPMSHVTKMVKHRKALEHDGTLGIKYIT